MLHIVKDSEPSLREKSAPVETPLSEENQQLIDEMLHYLLLSQDPKYREKHPACREGVGLAAPQVGHNVRMIVISYATGDEKNPRVQYQLVNPRIVVNSVRKCFLSGGEGCLSVEEEHPGRVYRDFKIVGALPATQVFKNIRRLQVGSPGALYLNSDLDSVCGFNLLI